MAQRVTHRLMGLQNCSKNPYGRNTFQPDIWHRSSLSCRISSRTEFFDEHSNDDQLKLNWIVWMKSEIKLLKEWPSISGRWQSTTTRE